MSRVKMKQSKPILPSPMPEELDLTYDGSDSDGSPEKDKTELELEKLVFGDEAGFHQSLSAYERDTHGLKSDAISKDQSDNGEEKQDDEGIEGVDDADLFFLDSGPSAAPDSNTIRRDGLDENDGQTGLRGVAAWVDSDDERMVVSLASNPRLRKLRIAESEDFINGREYTKRLRRQFERLHPVPDWANPSAAAKAKKRRRASIVSRSSGEDGSAAEMSLDSDDLSAQPLAKLLHNNTDFIRAAPTLSSGRKKLRPEVIDIQRTKDVGLAQPSSITSLVFHPKHSLLLSSGPASTLYLHHISPHPPNPNPLLTSLHVRSTPISTSAFLPPDGSKIFFSGRRRYFHTWDLSSGKIDKITHVYGHRNDQRSMERFKLSPCGRWMGLVGSGRKGCGLVTVLNARTCQWVAEVQVEGRGGVADFAWWGDGEGMVVLGKGGEAVEWDGREKRVVACWVDEGAVGTTVMALGGSGAGPRSLGGDRWLAVGSSSGIVNVYDRKGWSAGETVPPAPKPTRAFDHLTTPTSHLKFSTDGQLLAMASRWKRDALRLVHLPSCTVYKNWPTASTPLGRITAVAFAPGVQPMLAVANEQGKIRLWEVRG